MTMPATVAATRRKRLGKVRAFLDRRRFQGRLGPLCRAGLVRKLGGRTAREMALLSMLPERVASPLVVAISDRRLRSVWS